jgi:hypothetical protein
VAYEILAGAGHALTLTEIAVQGAERLLMADAFVRDTGSLRAALHEDNRRREGAGRKPLFAVDGDAVTLVAQPEPGEHAPLPAVARVPASAAELRRAALAALRRRMRESDGPTVEHVATKLLVTMGFRDLKVAKRGREHVICTGRRRMGVAEVRHAIRIVRSGADTGRRDVTDLRRDIGHYGAQIGMVISAGEANRDARGEAVAAGQLPVLLVCGEALAEALADAGIGNTPVVVPEVDDAFFRAAAEAADKEEEARLARREERERRREGREERADEREARTEREPRAPAEAIAEPSAGTADLPAGDVPPAPATAAAFDLLSAPASADDEGEGGEDDEGDEEGSEEAEPGEQRGEAKDEAGPGERRRRRRRRRRRGGRGRGREGAGSAAAAPAGQGTGEAGAEPAAAQPSAPAPSEPSRSGGGDPGPTA